MSGNTEAHLSSMGIILPTPAAPAANYVPYVMSGNLLTISGQVPVGPDGLEYQGKLGDGFDVETGQKAARLCAINILAQAKAALGDLDRIVKMVKITGYVNAAGDFGDHPAVINGASDLLVEALGERGKHARAAVGMSSLPFGVAVEVDAIIEFN